MSSTQNKYDTFDESKSENLANDQVSYEYRNKYSVYQNLPEGAKQTLKDIAKANLDTASKNFTDYITKNDQFLRTRAVFYSGDDKQSSSSTATLGNDGKDFYSIMNCFSGLIPNNRTKFDNGTSSDGYYNPIKLYARYVNSDYSLSDVGLLRENVLFIMYVKSSPQNKSTLQNQDDKSMLTSTEQNIDNMTNNNYRVTMFFNGKQKQFDLNKLPDTVGGFLSEDVKNNFLKFNLPAEKSNRVIPRNQFGNVFRNFFDTGLTSTYRKQVQNYDNLFNVDGIYSCGPSTAPIYMKKQTENVTIKECEVILSYILNVEIPQRLLSDGESYNMSHSFKTDILGFDGKPNKDKNNLFAGLEYKIDITAKINKTFAISSTGQVETSNCSHIPNGPSELNGSNSNKGYNCTSSGPISSLIQKSKDSLKGCYTGYKKYSKTFFGCKGASYNLLSRGILLNGLEFTITITQIRRPLYKQIETLLSKTDVRQLAIHTDGHLSTKTLALNGTESSYIMSGIEVIDDSDYPIIIPKNVAYFSSDGGAHVSENVEAYGMYVFKNRYTNEQNYKTLVLDNNNRDTTHMRKLSRFILLKNKQTVYGIGAYTLIDNLANAVCANKNRTSLIPNNTDLSNFCRSSSILQNVCRPNTLYDTATKQKLGEPRVDKQLIDEKTKYFLKGQYIDSMCTLLDVGTIGNAPIPLVNMNETPGPSDKTLTNIQLDWWKGVTIPDSSRSLDSMIDVTSNFWNGKDPIMSVNQFRTVIGKIGNCDDKTKSCKVQQGGVNNNILCNNRFLSAGTASYISDKRPIPFNDVQKNNCATTVKICSQVANLTANEIQNVTVNASGTCDQNETKSDGSGNVKYTTECSTWKSSNQEATKRKMFVDKGLKSTRDKIGRLVRNVRIVGSCVIVLILIILPIIIHSHHLTQHVKSIKKK